MANQKKSSGGKATGGSAKGRGRGGGAAGGQGSDRRLQRGQGGGPDQPEAPSAARGEPAHERETPPLDEEREARKD